MMKRRAALSCILMLLGAMAFAEVGTIVYIEGEVTVVRDGEKIWEPVDFGFPVESFDLIKTGRDGLVELQLDEPSGLDATITVQPDTSFYLDVDRRRRESPSGVELLGGTVSVALKQYGAGFQVRTREATMGVRGTVFDVATSVQGDVLVTCTEGAVVCSTDGGPELVATPGQAVEARVGERLRNLTIGGANTDAFRADWMLDRLAAFQSDPLPLINLYARRYLELRNDFSEAYRTLMSRRDVLDKWMREDDLGTLGSTMERMRERRAVLPGLFAMRRVLFFFERIWFRLDVLLAEASGQIDGRQLDVGLTVAELARQFEDDSALLASRMDEVRYIFKLFAERNEGRLPFDQIESSEGGSLEGGSIGGESLGDTPSDGESSRGDESADDPFSDDPFGDRFPLRNRN